MKKNLLVAFLVVCLLSVSLVNADIVSWNCADDGDGGIVMNTPTWSYNSGSDEYTLSMTGKQNFYPAHVIGDFTTDTEEDPTVWIAETVDNNTTFAWTDYHITIGMTKSFSISTSVITPDDWTFIITQPSVLGGGQLLPNGGTGWLGTIDYYMGTGSAIGIGQSGDFGFKVSFAGSVDFCTEQIPTPEPATMTLLCIGALALTKRK